MEAQTIIEYAPNKYKRRLEIAAFWGLSKGLRDGSLSVDIVDRQILFYLDKPETSVWLWDKLVELRNMNDGRLYDELHNG